MSHTTKDLSNTSSLLFWNINKQKDYNIKVLKEILEGNRINALFFVEAIHKNNEFNKVFQNDLKEYNIQYLKGNMMVASKGPIKPIWYYEKNNILRFNHIKVKIDSTIFNIGLVDILNNFNKIPKSLNKKEAFNTIITYAEENHLDIVLGDFNTPYESVHFDKFQNNYNSAREFQIGFTGTWPSILPLFEIDQIWISKEREILKTEKYYFDNSDHAMLITYFTQKVD